MLKVEAVDPVEFKVTLQVPAEVELPNYDTGNNDQHPLLRRWDHKARDPAEGVPERVDDGALLIEEGAWLKLEDGVQVQFQAVDRENEQHTYRVGDYWLIPARVATGDVEWPGPVDDPEAVPSHGVEHHYAPLAIMGSSEAIVEDCRMEIAPPVVAASL